MKLQLQTFNDLVQKMAAIVQTSASRLLDLSVGSTLRAVLEASASIALWMQWLILLVLQTTRAATSVGGDLDSWMADFGLARLPATTASGVVTFSRFNSSLAALVPAGALVRTSDGSVSFLVVANQSVAGWTPSANAFVIPPGTASLDVPVVAQAAGAGGNVQAAAIAVLATAMPGVDVVTNGTAFTDGRDAESDDAFRLRFQTFISSLSRATVGAVEFAISGVQQGLSYAIFENQDAEGNEQFGNFVIIIDDGSGYPATALLNSVQQAVEAVRPVGTTFGVLSPSVVQASISLRLERAGSAAADAVYSAIEQTLGAYANALPIGAPLPITKVAQLVYNIDGSITNVTQVVINNQAGDLMVGPSEVVKLGTVVVV